MSPGCCAARESIQRLACCRRATSGRRHFSRPGNRRFAHRFRSVAGVYVCPMDDQAATLAVCCSCWLHLGLRDRCRRTHAGCARGVDVHSDYLCSACLATGELAERNRRRGARLARNTPGRSLRSIVSVNVRFRAVDRFDRSPLARTNAKRRCMAANDRSAISAGLSALVSDIIGSIILA